MKQSQFLFIGAVLLIAPIIGGCATGSSTPAGTAGQNMSQNLGDKAFQYRRQAAELREMARRLELEAEWYAQQAGPDSDQAKRAKEMARGFWATAEEANRLATEYQSQLPHNQVY